MSTVPEIRKQTVFQAPIEKVWQAVATAEGIASWFMENDFTAEEGATFTIHSPFGPSPCKVVTLDPPNELTFTWGDAGWKVSFLLEEEEDKTSFTLIHGGWGQADEIVPGPGPDKTNKDIRDTMDNGWDSIVYEALRKVVEG
ncbi:SRPBCC family protein [Evansella cellulosilytica]|uniref:Activator of Hsp90 ATPase 1 family protein n=1 Tax=Evansella cellulosilytica (strain ATCC 21833 / DSM 2522 / FERM P-1141 / JCM 9156 / N-4) TaxID=649639 RepID=E6TRS8_EVAC2|nr:SRPBCC domain-containing protein [Evansella cellulosilytica]ADU29451.1 Activator of Hsp90 ATPase 1 family protein [Evansella cellulosilytica DSM 2522]